MKVLIIGGGGREHALCWKLAQSKQVTGILCAPGNGGTQRLARNVPIAATEIEKLRDLAILEKVDLVVVGPDDVLALGAADVFEEAGILCFGPKKAAAKLESSKSFAKDFMKRHGIPCAISETFTNCDEAQAWCLNARYPLVIKADGLALGKGVVIAETPAEAAQAIVQMMEQKIFGVAGETILIEEFLRGTECSIHAFVDGTRYLLCPDAKDHKRVGEGDVGPNTGGMGTISPSGVVNPTMEARIHREILEPFVAGLKADGLDFRGMLFPGLMITTEGPKVLEFNCRFGDPETQVLMRRLESDLVDLLLATCRGTLEDCKPVWREEAAVCVVMASGGYPGNYEKGLPIAGLQETEAMPEVVIFHAGTALCNQETVTSGGRVLGVTSTGKSLAIARKQTYQAVEQIDFEGGFVRRDIGGEIL